MDKEKLAKIQAKIREEYENKPNLQKLLEIKRLTEKTNDLLKGIETLDRSKYDSLKNNFDELKLILKELKEKEIIIPEFPTEIMVSNFPSFPEIKTETVEFPKNLKELKNLDIDSLIQGINEIQAQSTKAIVKALSSIYISNRKAEDYIPVRIAYLDSAGNITFDPEKAAGGTATPAFHTGFKDANGKEAFALVDDSGHLQTDINFSGTVDLGNVGILDDEDNRIHPATEATLAKTVSVYQQVKQADDMVKTINYTDGTKTVVSNIVMTSATLGKTVTETLNNSGGTTLVITRVVS